MEHRFEIRRIPLWPAVRIAFVMFLVIGILFAILYAFFLAGLGFIAGTVGGSGLHDDFGIVRNLGFVMIPIIAIMYALFGTLVAVIWVLVYNLLASIVGGVEIDLKLKEGGGPGAPFDVASSTENGQ